MSGFNLTIGIPVMALAGSFVVGAVLPDPDPITVHSLKYESGIIFQDRTVETEGEIFYATWTAEIVAAESDEVVCRGEGSWPYSAGRREAAIPIDEWVGEAGCLQSLDVSQQYYPRAAWFWGEDQTSHAGEPFTP